MKHNRWLGLLLIFTTLSWSQLCLAQPSWSQWLAEFKQEAIADGIDAKFFDQVFAGVKPTKRVLNFDRRQPERRLTFLKYRSTRADNYRIRLGKQEYRKYKQQLTTIGKQFGVDPCFITSIWGMETSYGRFMGSFPVIKSLATLAYDKRRSKFFRRELLYALHILQDGHVSQDKFKGEWAGASGHSQFLPSSWYKYAVDYDQDGRKNIWTSLDDAWASIANYLKQNGWRTGEPWGYEVTLPKNFDPQLTSNKVKKSVTEWLALGVRLKKTQKVANPALSATIITPYGGPPLMAFNNFRVIMRYNNSIYYAGTISFMADRICGR